MKINYFFLLMLSLFFVSVCPEIVYGESNQSSLDFSISKPDVSSNQVLEPDIPKNGQLIRYRTDSANQLPKTGEIVRVSLLLMGEVVLLSLFPLFINKRRKT
ncbi:LPXTG cell wall anchor domain-containing protein [Vagococcus carniphilus]|uniref:LPXTG cell wall anchor domain-containing protein n=1 Tax=Vagococcus carniphilus TaxID=218144 RepID=UPI003B5C5496